MKTKRVVSIICIILVLVMIGSLVISAFGGAMAATQSEIDALKAQQAEINRQKEALNSQISDLQGEMEVAMDLKVALDEQNELTRQEIELINEQISLYEGLVEQKAKELEEALAAEELQKEELRVRMRQMEEKGTLSYISILFKATSFTDFLSRLDSVEMIMKRDKEVEEAYIAARKHVEAVKAEYEATLAECEDKKIELEAKKAELEVQIASAAQVILDLEDDIDEYKAQYDAFDAQSSAIGATINQKIAELEAQQAQTPGGIVTGTGTYSWPLPGYRPGSAYGWRLHPIFNEMRFHAGEDVGAPSGTPILAADGGTVITANVGWGGGYGNYVVISHGGGRSTLYAHMSSLAVTYGQTVSKGQVIGYVGSTGWSTGPHLHFETRVNGSTTDPKGYFSF